jgi:glutathione peroxidase
MKTGLVIAFIFGLGLVYVAMDNKKQKSMTFRQKILKTFYPLIMKGTKKQIIGNKDNVLPVENFYAMSVTLNDGSILDMGTLKGKKILIVNVASDCGFTGQYEALEKIYSENKDRLVVIGFPANDFKNQEKQSDVEIGSFCKKNYGVTFPIAKKGVVIKTKGQQSVYKWLTDKNLNGWNTQAPTWNFCKYIIDEKGVLIRFTNSGVTPEAAFQ